MTPEDREDLLANDPLHKRDLENDWLEEDEEQKAYRAKYFKDPFKWLRDDPFGWACRFYGQNRREKP